MDIKLTFKEIENMSVWSFKKLVKSKTKAAGLKYLLGQKERQSKTLQIQYDELAIQEYLVDGHCKKSLSQLIFQARSKTLDIKMQQKWKYADKICIGCKTREESGEEILLCENLNYENRVAENPIKYDWFFSITVSDMVKVGLVMEKGLKEREKILEAGVT